MDTYGNLIAPNTIQFKRLLPGPIERIWAYLTESAKRSKWLASGDMDLRVGGETELFWLHSELDTAKPDEAPEKYRNGHRMKARITRCEPPHVLAYTWGAREDALSEVVFELSEQGAEVLLVPPIIACPTRTISLEFPVAGTRTWMYSWRISTVALRQDSGARKPRWAQSTKCGRQGCSEDG